MGFKPQDFGQKSHFYGQLLTRFRPKTPSRREFVGHLVEKLSVSHRDKSQSYINFSTAPAIPKLVGVIRARIKDS
jgi:hypothetical protein